MPRVENGRRPAGYYFRARARANERQLSMLSDEQFEELAVVNQVRQQVRAWRAAGYPGATPVTRQLLAHWTQPERERRLFFCQLEAAETVIWLVEIRGDRRLGIDIPLDTPLDGASKPLLRYAVKMATGSGKTVVMAMLMAWSFVNKAYTPQDRRFSDGVLIVTPNLTVKERLGGGETWSVKREGVKREDVMSEDGEDEDVEEGRATSAWTLEPERPLLPGARGNYFERFDLAPANLLPYLGQGRVLISNWQALALRDDGGKRQVVQRGRESAAAFANRSLRDLGSKKNLLVINDEAHHAYRPAPYDDRRPDGIGADYNTPVNVAAFEAEAKRILAEVEAECGWMVETWHPHCDHPQRVKARINYTVWSMDKLL
jgi:type III restriction enzyme